MQGFWNVLLEEHQHYSYIDIYCDMRINNQYSCKDFFVQFVCMYSDSILIESGKPSGMDSSLSKLNYADKCST